jgi:hypothetical protein
MVAEYQSDEGGQAREYNFLWADVGKARAYRNLLGAIQTEQREIGRRIGLAVRASPHFSYPERIS